MLPRQPQPTSVPGQDCSLRGEETTLCKKYIRGTCTEYGQCRYRHELDTEKMKEILQFCHDYQNRIGCTRENCKYVHATKEEQELFLSTGQIPRVLAERYALAEANMQNNAETIPQIAMFISESYMSQPPPSAPWPPLPPQGAVAPVATAPPPPPPASPPRHPPALPAQQAQQLPPPPTPASNAAQLAPPTYAAMPPPQMQMTQPPPNIVVPSFDASRPPPPIIPSLMQTNNSSSQLKRKIDTNGNAATNKRKLDGSELSANHCENCIQREIRIDGYKHEMEALHNEEETQILLYKKKLQEYEMGKDILKKIAGPELYTVFHNVIESSQGDQAPQLDNLGASFMSSSSSTVSKQAQTLLQLFQMWLGGGARNVIEPPVPSTSHMDETLQSLTSLSRRHNSSYINTRPDLYKFVVDTVRNSAAERPTVEERPNEPDMSRMSRTNGFMSNGQKAQASASESRYNVGVGYGAPSAPIPSHVAGPSGYVAPAPAAYPVYHPAFPPPNRPYFAQGPVAPGSSNLPYNGAERAAGLGPSQGMPPPAPSAALRPNQTNAPNYNYTIRPQPPYYPPYP